MNTMLKILNVGTISRPVPSKGYGGTQRVCWWLTEGFQSLAQHVILTAVRGSSPEQLPVVITQKTKPRLEDKPKYLKKYYEEIKSHAPYKFDIILGHGHWIDGIKDFFPETMICATIHGHQEALPQWAHPIFISHSQRREYQKSHNNLKGHVIHNPLKLDEFIFKKNKPDYLLFLAKLDWGVKGLDVAIEIAKTKNIPLKIAGPGFNKHINAMLTDKIEYVGEVFGQKKAELLANAKALLYPTQWPEPFGLAPAEANASGTPALVLNNGAMPEVVKNGVSGFVCDSKDALFDAVDQIHTLKPDDCRDWVKSNFDHIKIAQKYSDVFHTLLKSS